MSMFTLAIFCLTTYNLPRFMDLTFQVPMQYFSLQLRTLLPSPVISTTGCFCFGSVSSFFLELFLHWSPVAYWAPREFIFQCPIFFPFHTLHGVLKARILKWFAIPFSSGPWSKRQRRKGKIHPFECRAPKNSIHFSILALRTAWTEWKGKKIGHWKMKIGRASCRERV